MPATFVENQDGSFVVKLDGEITVNGDTLSRVGIPVIRGRHLMAAPFAFGESPSLGEWATLASRIVTPPGAYEELGVQDAIDVAAKVSVLIVGKHPATGEKSSP